MSYELQLDSTVVPLRVGQELSIHFTSRKECIHCGRRVKKLYQNGYCFPCMRSLAECDLCIVKPHECHFHNGTCRDEDWGQAHCFIPHYVYLAVSSDIKVGLTRKGRELTRWMEQGAEQAVLLAEVPTRKLAGELEMEIAKHVPDKTNWRKMLIGGSPQIDLLEKKREVLERLDTAWEPYLLREHEQPRQFSFPQDDLFEPKLTSLSLDKQGDIVGRIRGLKGQYVLLDEGVLNLKKHAGYDIELSVSAG
ncbi:DUF2797 domain-containing protein [Alicyclobacillus sp. SO9]|uniref:DUF2797 domain-containing protein n=1 Tax=Alicyclobacillus sp. SO9 TaxID=2665646 RepID=UPI001E48B1D6|nr:DUF2797 domain-containing protein [Alicyclobacillus sp. SO9]